MSFPVKVPRWRHNTRKRVNGNWLILSIYQTSAPFIVRLLSVGKNDSPLHTKRKRLLDRGRHWWRAKSFFVACLVFGSLLIWNKRCFTSAKLCIWCPNTFTMRHPAVSVYMPVKHFAFPVESSLGTTNNSSSGSSLRRKSDNEWELWGKNGLFLWSWEPAFCYHSLQDCLKRLILLNVDLKKTKKKTESSIAVSLKQTHLAQACRHTPWRRCSFYVF